MTITTTRADAQHVHDEWDRRTRAHGINGLLVWEYPRDTAHGDQVDITEVMDLAGPKITHHRIYWGWFGTPLLQPSHT